MSLLPSTFKGLRNLIIAVLLVGLGGVVGFRLGRGQNVPLFPSNTVSQISRLTNTGVPSQNSSVDFSHFWDVWNRLEAAYYDPSKLDANKMVDGAIQGMVASLGDPYTMYLPKEDQQRTSDDLQGQFGGVGIELGYKNQTLVVIAPLKGMPAAAAGVQAGDYILHIKDTTKGIDKDTNGISLPDAVDEIRGPKGSTVTLTFLRDGGKPEEKTLTRDTIVVPSVDLSYIQKNGKTFADLRLSQFGGNTDEEWKKAVNDIVSHGKVDGVILDVRNNPGGFLEEAVSIASEFIPDGVVVTQQGKDQTIPYYAAAGGKLTKMSVDVLINKGSASAAEIVSGALRDRRGAKLIGEKSFGKGTVQDALELPDGTGLHITVAKWLTPSGEWVHGKGLTPTIPVTIDPNATDQTQDPQLDAAIKALE
ncbi:peptidase S41 [Candidatus Cerribacteria bacterium 'Amazon FNV 2010 28 9']|uniref:Peptidase S41 n=1 Tax=Candidatus Cerribacteria bacterium 'Amazon FNV 2010 28 9' TaxID=2081795 RepID=A0A317JNK3_9BACT|nr:MAG: peptidase S41 [Candidatus Cerribacteria bacterium 'Amazon FNV 2010 28 9']